MITVKIEIVQEHERSGPALRNEELAALTQLAPTLLYSVAASVATPEAASRLLDTASLAIWNPRG